jgi:hypothetical protein
MGHQVSGDAPRASRPAKRYRGSSRRLKRIGLRGNSSWALWLLVAWVAFLVFIVVPWMMRQAH